MKKIAGFLLGISMTMCCLIVYINQNIRLIQTSYHIQQKNHEVAYLSDEYKQLVYEMNSLHSPANLESKIARSGIELIYPTDVRLIKNVVPVQHTFLAHKGSAEKGQFNLLGSLEFIPDAHANSSTS